MFSPKSPAFPALLGALTALTALSIDMSLPALPTFQKQFYASPSASQATLSLFLLGYALSQFVCGPISDRRGRRPVLLAGLLLFTLAGLLCAASPTLPLLILARFLQGIGAGVGPVLSRALVRDHYERHAAAGVFSQITQIMILAPLVAPSLGGLFLATVGWRGIFGFLSAAGLTLWLVCRAGLSEPPRKPNAGGFSLRALAGQYRQILRHRTALGYALVVCFASAGMFAYISGSPLVLIQVFGVSTRAFGVCFALPAFALFLGATVNRAQMRQRPPEALLRFGIGTLSLGAVLLFLAAKFTVGGLPGVLIPMMLYLFGIGLAMPHATAAAMEPFPGIAGVASSLIGGLQTVAGSASGAVVSGLYDHSARSLAGTVLAMACGMLAAFVWVAPPGRRRVH